MIFHMQTTPISPMPAIPIGFSMPRKLPILKNVKSTFRYRQDTHSQLGKPPLFSLRGHLGLLAELYGKI
jgi:hypothetical protein